MVEGLDLDCGPFLAVHSEEAVNGGQLEESDIDGALVNTLTVQMRLGMFDGEPSAQPYGHLGAKDSCTPAHQQLALEAAQQGIVLLKNQGPVLPLLAHHHRTVAVIGPNSNVTVTMIGNYAGKAAYFLPLEPLTCFTMLPYNGFFFLLYLLGVACGYTTPLQGISRYSRTVHQQGCVDVACSDDRLFTGAIDAATGADATVLVMGLDQSIEAEFLDRTDLLLPGRQQELVRKVAAASKGPVVLVLMSGGPIDVSFAKDNPKIAAILWAGYPGQAGGAAIADILYGAANPGLCFFVNAVNVWSRLHQKVENVGFLIVRTYLT